MGLAVHCGPVVSCSSPPELHCNHVVGAGWHCLPRAPAKWCMLRQKLCCKNLAILNVRNICQHVNFSKQITCCIVQRTPCRVHSMRNLMAENICLKVYRSLWFPQLQKIFFLWTIFSRLLTFLTGMVKSPSLIVDCSLSLNDSISLEAGIFLFLTEFADLWCIAECLLYLLRVWDGRFLLHLYCV